jgi:hypothetical protein
MSTVQQLTSMNPTIDLNQRRQIIDGPDDVYVILDADLLRVGAPLPGCAVMVYATAAGRGTFASATITTASHHRALLQWCDLNEWLLPPAAYAWLRRLDVNPWLTHWMTKLINA